MRARILPPTPENLGLAARELAAGGLVGMPTETVYGLAANVFDESAIAKVYSVKERPAFDPLIAHVAPDSAGVKSPWAFLEGCKLVDPSSIDAGSRKLVESLVRSFWPGPLTLVLPRGKDVPELATSGLQTVGVRFPAHPVAQALIRAAGFPLAAPSANRFGRISPTSAADVDEELGDRIAIILDGGRSQVGVESTVLAVAGGAISLLRPGGVSLEEIERATGRRPLPVARDSVLLGASPGTLESHYAPSKPLFLLGSPVSEKAPTLPPGTGALGLILFQGDSGRLARESAALEKLAGKGVVAKVLSQKGDLAEAARNLFAVLRELDRSDARAILAEPCPVETGLGHAITDRLKRASRR